MHLSLAVCISSAFLHARCVRVCLLSVSVLSKTDRYRWRIAAMHARTHALELYMFRNDRDRTGGACSSGCRAAGRGASARSLGVMGGTNNNIHECIRRQIAPTYEQFFTHTHTPLTHAQVTQHILITYEFFFIFTRTFRKMDVRKCV